MDFLDNEERIATARLKAQGATEEQLFTLRQSYQARRISSLQRHHAEVKDIDTKAAIDDVTAINKINTEEQVATFEHQAKLREKREAAAKERLSKQKAEHQKLLDQQRAFNRAAMELEEELGFQNALNAATEEQKEIIEAQRRHERNLEILRLGNESTYQAEIAHQIALKAIRDKYNPPKVEGEGGLTPAQMEQIAAEVNLQSNLTAAVQDGETGRAAIREAAFQDTMTKLDVISNATTAFASLIGEQTAAGKALGIASALINTYQGATEVLRAKTTLPEPFGTIQKIASMAAVIASGIKAVKAITAVKVPGKGGGGVSVPSVSAPALPQASTTSLDQSSINGIGNAASGRAFVLDRDIEGNRERAQRLNRAARIN
jgi:hypothetical protein